MQAFIPSFVVSQKVAHFYPKNDDIFYLSSKYVNISRNKMNKLKTDVTEKIDELKRKVFNIEDEVVELTIEIRRKKEMKEQILSEYSNSISNLIHSIYDYKRWSNYIDCDDFNNTNANKMHLQLHIYNETVLEDKIIQPLRLMKFDLENTRSKILTHINLLEQMKETINNILVSFSENNKTIKEMEVYINNLIQVLEDTHYLKTWFADTYFELVRISEVRRKEEEQIKRIKSIVGKYKHIKMLRDKGFSPIKYVSEYAKMHNQINRSVNQFNEYKEVIEYDIVRDIKKYVIGYEDGKSFKVRPSNQNELNRLKQKYNELVEKNSIFTNSILYELEEMIYYAEHKNENKEEEYFKDNDILNKYHNAILLRKKIEKELEEYNKMTTELANDIEADFTD